MSFDITFARALHLIAIVQWIGGVFFVTLVILPTVRKLESVNKRYELFERIEGLFALYVKFFVVLAGASGIYMVARLGLWARFIDPKFFWMHEMLFIWGVFVIMLFIAEPLFLHAWFRNKAMESPESTYKLIIRSHWVLLILSLITLISSVLGAHGALQRPCQSFFSDQHGLEN